MNTDITSCGCDRRNAQSLAIHDDWFAVSDLPGQELVLLSQNPHLRYLYASSSSCAAKNFASNVEVVVDFVDFRFPRKPLTTPLTEPLEILETVPLPLSRPIAIYELKSSTKTTPTT
jgi:hypothetical protein